MSQKPVKNVTKPPMPHPSKALGEYVTSSFNNNDIIASRTGYNQKTGEKYSLATDTKGLTIKLTQSKEGVKELTVTQVPNIDTKEKRDNVIKEMAAQNKTQGEIAQTVGVSQSTVSNVLKKKKK